MATHSGIFAWRIPWTEEPGVLQFIGLHRVEHYGSDLACGHTHGDRKTKELRVHSGAQAHFCHPKSPQTSTLPPTSVCASVE